MSTSLQSTELSIARYQEDLKWVTIIPRGIQATIFNKGSIIKDSEITDKVSLIESRRNSGREAETYLHHLVTRRDSAVPEGFTIFCQGDPIAHSPRFLELLEQRDSWADIQPLTVHWLAEQNIPPAQLIARDTSEHLAGIPIRTELYSLHDWNAIHYLDEGAVRIGRDYLTGHGLPMGTNIAAHFLRAAGWNELAEEADAADFGQFAFGAIFAVRNERLMRIPEDVLQRMHIMSRSHPIYPWIFERLWLHFFGLPFHPALVRHPMPQREFIPA